MIFERDLKGREKEDSSSIIAKDVLFQLNKFDIIGLEEELEELRKKRAEFTTAFENYNQKAIQFFNLLSAVMKAMTEMKQGVIRNIL